MKTLGTEEPIDFGNQMIFFINRVHFTLNDGTDFTMYLYDDGIYFLTEYKNNVLYGFYVTDKNFGKELFETALSYFVPAEETSLSSYELRLGDKLTTGTQDSSPPNA